MNVDQYIVAKLTHSIHTSERRSFRACRRRWKWLFTDHLYPTVTPKPLEFGSAFHKGMEAWYEPTTWNKDPETRQTLATLAFVNLCNEQKAKYLQLNDGRIDPAVEQDFDERLELGRGMIKYHCEQVSPRLDQSFTPVAVEIEFEVPITSPEGVASNGVRIAKGMQLWCKCDNCFTMWMNSPHGEAHHSEWLARQQRPSTYDDPHMGHFDGHQSKQYYRQMGWQGLPVTYGGRIDMFAADEHGRYWVFDWKTAARLSGQEETDSSDDFIYLDDQITSYVWALWVLGLNVAGFVYHEMKKGYPKEPEPNTRLYQGRWYSVNKQQDTSLEIYHRTISENDPAGLASGAYDEFLEWLKQSGPRYYSRKQVHRNETELINAGVNIYLEALDMVDPNLRLYPSPGRFGCTTCAYRQPCLGLNRGEDVEYLLDTTFEKRPHRYWETVPSNTDSKGGQ